MSDLAHVCIEAAVPAHASVYLAGDMAEEVYIVLSGSLMSFPVAPDQPQLDLRRSAVGGMVGEMSMLGESTDKAQKRGSGVFTFLGGAVQATKVSLVEIARHHHLLHHGHEAGAIEEHAREFHVGHVFGAREPFDEELTSRGHRSVRKQHVAWR